MCVRTCVCVYSSKYRVATSFNGYVITVLSLTSWGKRKRELSSLCRDNTYICAYALSVRICYISIFIYMAYTDAKHICIYTRAHRHDVIHMSAYGNRITATKIVSAASLSDLHMEYDHSFFSSCSSLCVCVSPLRRRRCRYLHLLLLIL